MSKKCRQCRKLFEPINSLNIACGFACAVLLAQTPKGKDHRLKAVRKETRELKQQIKTRSQWATEAQAAFNRYIRLRDAGHPCISCDKPDNGLHQRHASHYRSVGACSALRFDTFNVHASCATCNAVKSGNLIEYRIRLTAKLGLDKINWLECQNEITRHDIDYLKRIKRIFTAKAKRLQAREKAWKS